MSRLQILYFFYCLNTSLKERIKKALIIIFISFFMSIEDDLLVYCLKNTLQFLKPFQYCEN